MAATRPPIRRGATRERIDSLDGWCRLGPGSLFHTASAEWFAVAASFSRRWPAHAAHW